MKKNKNEKEYYNIIKEKLEKKLREICKECRILEPKEVYLEITSDKDFSNKIKAKIQKGIIFTFLKEAKPDFTGFINNGDQKFIVVEIKKEIKLAHIYQLKRYKDLFDADFALLISLEEIPEEIKKLDEDISLFSKLANTPFLAPCPYYFGIVHFDPLRKQFLEWYPENPFEKCSYWE